MTTPPHPSPDVKPAVIDWQELRCPVCGRRLMDYDNRIVQGEFTLYVKCRRSACSAAILQTFVHR